MKRKRARQATIFFVVFFLAIGFIAGFMKEPWDVMPTALVLLTVVCNASTVPIRPYLLRFAMLTVVLSSITLIEAFVPAGGSVGDGKAIFRTCTQSALASIIILTPFVMLARHRIARAISATLYAIVIACPIFLWCYFFAARRWASGDTFVAIAQTHASEALEYWSDQMGFFGTLAVLALLFSAILFGRWLTHMGTRNANVRLSRRVICLILLVLNLGTCTLLCAPKLGSYYARIGSEGWFALKNIREFRTHHAQHADILATIPHLAPASGGLHILVLGESQDKEYMHAYGYEKDTTPWLDAAKDTDACVFFQHAYSCHVYTAAVLQFALTEKSQYTDLDVNDALSIVEVARAAGYRTFWLSNQGKNGISDTPVSVIAHDAEERVFLNDHQYLDATHFDDALVKTLDDAIATIQAEKENGMDDAAGTLIVVHILGCHGIYSARYPEDAAVFDGSTRVGSYENAVRYNDSVMQKIYEHAKQAPDFRDLVYFSDHGEAVASGHTHDPDQYEPCMTYIPFYIFFSDAGRAARPDAYAALRANAGKPWTNDLAYEVLVTLLGLTPPRAIRPGDDIASPDYDGDLARLRTCHGEREITPEEAAE